MARNTGLLHPTEILGRPDFTQPVVLATGTTNAQAFDSPAGMAIVGFSFNADVWVAYGSTSANIPATTSTGTTGSELNPTMRNIGSTAGCTGISICSDFAAKGCLTWYRT